MKKITLIYTALILMLLLASCSEDKEEQAQTPAEQTQIISANDKIITLDVVSGKTVFELLQSQNQIEFSQSPQGVFVLSINSIKNQGSKAWRYFINGRPGTVACDKAVVFGGDVVEWRYE